MKQGIHPKYEPAIIVCTCGNVIHTYSTRQNIKIEICSNCHPFYTGRKKIVNSAGRVEKFKKKYGASTNK